MVNYFQGCDMWYSLFLSTSGQALTLKNVVARLKYRYDREIDGAERSILRKVTEQDDVPQKTMVLCVTDVKVGTEDWNVSAVSMSFALYLGLFCAMSGR